MSQNAPAYPRRSLARYLIDAAKSLVTGLGITGRYLAHPKTIVTRASRSSSVKTCSATCGS